LRQRIISLLPTFYTYEKKEYMLVQDSCNPNMIPVVVEVCSGASCQITSALEMVPSISVPATTIMLVSAGIREGQVYINELWFIVPLIGAILAIFGAIRGRGSGGSHWRSAVKHT
ncbi:MAG: hypothetical protein WCC94_07035, partial [Candidatus Bathyarchaeia archaeon]